MGQEVGSSHFKKQDFTRFQHNLEQETALLRQWMADGALSQRHGVGGFELEAWLTDPGGCPAPINEPYLALFGDNDLISPELSRFNVELNSTPLALQGDALRRMHAELQENWGRCAAMARRLDAELLMIGTLPTLDESMLTLENMSRMERYRALNEQVMRLRRGRPLLLDIPGIEHLRTVHHDVMLEAATTSFQVHLQVGQAQAVRFFNAMQIASAPLVAIAANSPLLFGRRLWHETRIPLFEQAVAVGGVGGAAFGPIKRVTFGSGYAQRSLFEFFVENLEHYPLLLPAQLDDAPERLAHLRLHNGTIWRWNRPLIGFDEDGRTHLRIENRVIPAGPTVLDAIANAALLFGLVQGLATAPDAPESRLAFSAARDNLYAAARHGLEAQLLWLDGRRGSARELLAERLLPLAREGLQALGFAAADIADYLGVIEERLAHGQNGAAWQLAWLERYGPAYGELVQAYREQQNGGEPVARWSL